MRNSPAILNSRAERRAAPEPAPARRETRLARHPSKPARAGSEPGPTLRVWDRSRDAADKGLQ